MHPLTVATAALLLTASLAACAHRPWEDPGTDWKQVRSQHFVVDTDGDAGDYQPVIGHLEDIHQALARTFFEGVDVPRVRVLLFARERDFKALTEESKLAGFFDPRLGAAEGGTLVFSSQTEDFAYVASIAAHELAHRFVHAFSRTTPAWLDEGFAKYVGAIELNDDLVIFDAGAMSLGYVYFSQPVPFRELFAATELAYHGAASDAHYMTSWLLVRHLLGRPGAGTKARFRTLLRSAAGSPAANAAAVSAAMDGMPIDQVEAQVQGTYHSIYAGMGQAQSRTAVAVTLDRRVGNPLDVTPANREEIRNTCQAARLGWMGATTPARPIRPPPPPPPDPRDACFAGHAQPAAPRLRVAHPGVLKSDDIREVMRTHTTEVKACYWRALDAKPTLAGQVEMRFKISADGSVGFSQVMSTTVRDVEVETCIGRALCRWMFPRPFGGGEVMVTYSYELNPTAVP